MTHEPAPTASSEDEQKLPHIAHKHKPRHITQIPHNADQRKLQRMEWFVGVFAFILIVSSMTLSFMSNTCKQVSALISEQNAAASQVGISILDYYNKSQDVDKDTQPPPGFLNDIVEFSRRNATIIYTSDRMSIRRDIRSVFASKSDELLNRIKQFTPTDGTSDHFTHFTVNPSAHSTKDLVTEGENQIRLYQVIRDEVRVYLKNGKV